MATCNQESLQPELDFLQQTMRHNGYSRQQTHHNLYLPQKVKPPQENLSSVTWPSCSSWKQPYKKDAIYTHQNNMHPAKENLQFLLAHQR
jgi:hypothetical protein